MFHFKELTKGVSELINIKIGLVHQGGHSR